MFPKRKIRPAIRHKEPPEHITDSFVLHFEDIKPTHKIAKMSHRLVYLIGFSLIGSSLVFCACRAV